MNKVVRGGLTLSFTMLLKQVNTLEDYFAVILTLWECHRDSGNLLHHPHNQDGGS